ncbi:MAG TPA: DUF2191 domain-containing protein [Polyangia bacterium]|jgi:hypothetical protein|nr:DUF2191 domain-containing protein [Polyangia bacterium]
MRTTLVLDDALLSKIRKIAAEKGETLTAVTEELLRAGLAVRSAAKKEERPALPIFRGGTGIAPGIDLDRTGALLAAEDEEAYRGSR